MMTPQPLQDDDALPPCTGAACTGCSGRNCAATDGHGCLQEPVHAARLQERMVHYARKAGTSDEVLQDMLDVLKSEMGQGVLALQDLQLHSVLMNDAYKLHMAAMYCEHLTGVDADFALNVRKTPLPLGVIRAEPPGLFACLQWRVRQLQRVQPYSEAVLQAVREFMDWEVPQAVQERAGVAPVTWQDIGGNPVAIASGPIDAASNVETTCMQLVQEHTILAEVAKIRKEKGSSSASLSSTTAKRANGMARTATPSSNDDASNGMGVDQLAERPVLLDRTERLANSLGHLCGVVTKLNACPHDFSILLMAGRRSTDLLHLLLQNLLFMRSVRGYVGTSAVGALALLRPSLHKAMPDPAQRKRFVGRLAGTHAHEMASAVQQLLVQFDHRAGELCGAEGPLCITQLVSHLLFLHSNGALEDATALPDTFTTASFLAAALAADVPHEFVEDVRERYGWTGVAPGAKCFDIFRVWRIDSGDYSAIAEEVVCAWERRCQQLKQAGQPLLPKPKLMHSNLSTVEEVVQLTTLPERIRPSSLGFGGLADGFIPFDCCDDDGGSSSIQGAGTPIAGNDCETCGTGSEIMLQPCSVVMKLVQARPSKHVPAQHQHQHQQPSAAKLGDDPSFSKMQVDPRLPQPERKAVQQELVAMAKRTAEHGRRSEVAFANAMSVALAEAYRYVTKQGALRGFHGVVA